MNPQLIETPHTSNYIVIVYTVRETNSHCHIFGKGSAYKKRCRNRTPYFKRHILIVYYGKNKEYGMQNFRMVVCFHSEIADTSLCTNIRSRLQLDTLFIYRTHFFMHRHLLSIIHEKRFFIFGR